MNTKTGARRLLVAAAGALLFLTATAAGAAEQCRDANGRFVKCPTASSAPMRCRDVTTKKFVKCGSPHSEAVPASSGK